jgi:hypothetical protein
MAEDIIPRSTSPVIVDAVVEKPLMSFGDAMMQVVIGKRVKRKEWGELNEYGFIKDGFLMIHKGADETVHVWKVSEGDMLGDDWYVAGEEAIATESVSKK